MGEVGEEGVGQLKTSKAAKSGETEGDGEGETFNPLPKPLVGGMAVTPDGKRLCYGFNLNECKVASPGAVELVPDRSLNLHRKDVDELRRDLPFRCPPVRGSPVGRDVLQGDDLYVGG